MLEKYLVEHCAPTLASLKTANLFNLPYTGEEELEQDLSAWNRCFAGKGVSLAILKKENGRALVYVYRKEALQRDLDRPGAAGLLSRCGYRSTEAGQALETLRERLGQSAEFPHEIGLFLGYPLGDVLGFIRHGGRDCKCVGCWKVYCDECEAVKTFARFKKCTEVYTRLWKAGRSVWQLTVAA
jgi:hypothetical protein